MFIELLEFQGRHVTFLAEELLPGAVVHGPAAAGGRPAAALPADDRRPCLLRPGHVLRRLVAFFRDIGLVEVRPDDLTDFGNILLHGILEPAPAETEVAA